MIRKTALFLSIAAIFLFAVTFHSFEIFPDQVEEKIQMEVDGTSVKSHEEHWNEAIQDLEETFDLSEEEVTDLETLLF